MSNEYRIFGAELSPYSVKVRSYFRYKEIPHTWIVRDATTQEEAEKYAKLPLIPVVVTPAEEGLQDSTPIIEKIEARHPEPSIHPDDPDLAFVSALLEEYGDEWGNKWMFHYRWAREVDQDSAASRLAALMVPGIEGEAADGVAGMIKQRMVGRIWFVGSNEQTAPQIEDSFVETIGILDAHLAERPYLFGGRPAFGDFGLFGQLYCAWTDPTPGAILREKAPHVCAWIARMLNPTGEGEFETWDELMPTLRPLLEREIGRRFLPWSDANSRALADEVEFFNVELGGNPWTQKPQKYHAKSLRTLRARVAALPNGGGEKLRGLLDATGCSRWLS